MREVLAIGQARTNAELMLDVVELGYLDRTMVTLDPTWGLGRFWKRWRPDHLVGSDLDPAKSPIGFPVDFTELPWPRCFDAVVLDGPYKLNGSGGSHASDGAYGVATKGVSWRARHGLIRDGITEAARVLVPGGTLLVKCQDQVCGGDVRWQTREFADHAESVGCTLIDTLLLPGRRAQPLEQRCRRCWGTGHERVRVRPVCSACAGAGWIDPHQEHARRNYSSLLVCRKKRGRK